MTTEPTSIAHAPHYRWGEGCDGWHLLRSDTLSVIEERMPAHTAERRHRHHLARQFFYVLAGELVLECEGEEHQLLAGTGLEVAPMLAHQAFNRSEREVRFLVISQPPSYGDRTDA